MPINWRPLPTAYIVSRIASVIASGERGAWSNQQQFVEFWLIDLAEPTLPSLTIAEPYSDRGRPVYRKSKPTKLR